MKRGLLVVAAFAAAFIAACLVAAANLGPPAPSTVGAHHGQAGNSSARPGTVAMTWPAPDDRLTPGATVPGCTYPRPASDRNVSTATKHRAALAYHFTGPAGIKHVEYDHRIPYALCGADTILNIWPEPVEAGFTQSGFAFNHKDEVETVLASKVRYHHMTLQAAQAVFAGDWRAGWCKFVNRPVGLC